MIEDYVDVYEVPMARMVFQVCDKIHKSDFSMHTVTINQRIMIEAYKHHTHVLPLIIMCRKNGLRIRNCIFVYLGLLYTIRLTNPCRFTGCFGIGQVMEATTTGVYQIFWPN